MNEPKETHRISALTLASLGIVFGDLGTSPLYAIRECFFGMHGAPLSEANILGVLSLIVWSLITTVCIKYLSIVLRADNHGEGGVLALMTLAHPDRESRRVEKHRFLLFSGIFGAALLYGDGMITPAISVLSAVEGLGVATPVLVPYVIPLTVAILILLFSFQRNGTQRIGSVFGPVILGWFLALGFLGVRGVLMEPAILAALNPSHALGFLIRDGWHSLWVLGAVFLAVTGAEALYADMGHFGSRPIRLAWFMVAFPSLILNYFGQGALLLTTPSAISNPFFQLAPSWSLYPLIGLATCATVIASQAVISGAFSLTSQAVQLGYLPRMSIRHTSDEEIGQIYVPQINRILLVASVWLVLEFRTSSNLAAAYGFAVSTTMVITTFLIYVVATRLWKWSMIKAILILMPLFAFDVAFFVANVLKIGQGGWFPLVVALVIFTFMTTWRTGRLILEKLIREKTVLFSDYLGGLSGEPPTEIPGTAIFLVGRTEHAPPALVQNIKFNRVIHEHVLLLCVEIEDVPHTPLKNRVVVTELTARVSIVKIHFGYKDRPNIPIALRAANTLGHLSLDLDNVTYFLGKETLLARDKRGMAVWREKLFSVMARNAQRATAYFQLPPDQVVEIGMQLEL